MNDNYYITEIILSNKVQMDTALLQGRKTKLPTRKVCKTKDFSCTILEYTWEHMDQDYWRKKGRILNLKKKKKKL